MWSTRNFWSDEPTFPMDIFPTPGMEDINIKIREAYAMAYDFTRRAIETGVREGELLPDVDVEFAANLIFIIYDGLRYSRMKSGIIQTPQKAKETIELVCDMLQRVGGTE